MKAFTKLLLVGAAAGAGYMVYRQRMASRAEDDLWSEATNAPDLTTAYQPVFDSAAPETETAPPAAKVEEKAPDSPAAPTDGDKDAPAAKDTGDNMPKAAKDKANGSK